MSKGNQNSQVVDTETTKKEKKGYKPLWIIISFIVLIAILLLPTPAGLPVMAKMTLAILAFAVCGLLKQFHILFQQR